MQPAQERFDLLRVEHGGRNQQGRRAGRDQRWIGFDVRFQRGLVVHLFLHRRVIGGLDRWIRSKTQLQQRLLARLLVCLGIHSHFEFL